MFCGICGLCGCGWWYAVVIGDALEMFWVCCLGFCFLGGSYIAALFDDVSE